MSDVSEPDDIALFDRWRDGDAESGEALFERYFDSIYNFFETKCHTEADELVQATFFACVRARDQFRKGSSFRTYLFTIARHELYRVLRNRQRDGERLDFELSSIAELVSTPGTKIARSQDHRRLIEALQRLSVEQQTLLELHYWEDMGIGELADVFEVQATVIRTRLYRARNALRDVMVDSAPAAVLDTLDTMDAWARGLVRQ